MSIYAVSPCLLDQTCLYAHSYTSSCFSPDKQNEHGLYVHEQLQHCSLSDLLPARLAVWLTAGLAAIKTVLLCRYIMEVDSL